MKFSALILQLTLGVLAYISNSEAADLGKDKRQVGQTAAGNLDTEQDRDTAATAFASAGLGHGKYFQDFYQVQLAPELLEFGHVKETLDDWEQRYAHQPAKDHYEFGHRRGNEHHFIERHEKAHPHAGEFKTKVRWGDKHGGYGEHYWDYNHAGHGHDDGEETKNEPQYAEYDGAGSEKKDKYLVARAKREPGNPNSDVEFIDETAKFLSEAGITGKHGGNYRWEPSVENRAKRTPTAELSNFVYDPNSGRIIDQNTGKTYKLTQVVTA